MNHFERWSPQQAKQHPFITGEPFINPFTPSMVPPSLSDLQPTAPKLQLPSIGPPIPHNMERPASSSSPAVIHCFQRAQEPDESCLSPSHSSLPSFHTIWPSQPQPSTSSPDLQTAIHYEEVGVNLDSKSLQDKSNYFHIPQVLESREDGLSNAANTDTIFKPMPSPQYHHHGSTQQTNHQGYQEQVLPLSSAPTVNNAVHDHQKATTMQAPPSTHMAILIPVTSGTDDRKLIMEHPIQHQSDTDSPSHSPVHQCHHKNDPTSRTSPGMVKLKHDHRLSTAPDLHTPPSFYSYQAPMTNEGNHQANHNASILSSDLCLQPTQQPPRFDAWNRSSSTWRRTRNMSSIDLERDADWTEERPSPHLTPNASHRRSHSNNVVSSPFNTSVLSRPSMVSLHRRVRGHPPLLQTYHRQDLEWDGVHTLLPYWPRLKLAACHLLLL